MIELLPKFFQQLRILFCNYHPNLNCTNKLLNLLNSRVSVYLFAVVYIVSVLYKVWQNHLQALITQYLSVFVSLIYHSDEELWLQNR